MDTEISRVAVDLQTMWTLVCAALVLFMQAGFCCLEAGAVRHKNSINVAIKNVVDLCVSFPVFFIAGYALMFGKDFQGLFGQPRLFLDGVPASEVSGFFYQAAFCSTAATIVSGGVAERCRFLPYLLISAVIAVFIYPLYGHWVWGGGALAQMGFHDFAGSSVVHMVGAGVTLAGVQLLGPRRDRFDPDGQPRTIPASSMPMIALGVVILAFGWIGFNGGSAPLGAVTATIVTNTMLAACFGGLGALLLTWAYRGLAAVDLILNGLLGGLVAVTACADVITMPAAALVGILGGASVVLGTALLERLRLDDAVGAIPVHGVAGIVGILLTAVFARPDTLAEMDITRWEFLGVQATGAGVCLIWSYGMGLLAWAVISRLTTLRVGPVEESIGMNYSEHEVDSAVAVLTQSVIDARQGRRLHEIDFDHVQDGQFAALAEAVRELIKDTGQTRTRAAEWSQDLDAISGSLDLNQRIGREAMQTFQDEMLHVDRTLHRIADFLGRTPADEEGLPMALDSVVNLRRRLELLGHRAPSGLDSWEEVVRTTERLDLLASMIRGDIRETH